MGGSSSKSLGPYCYGSCGPSGRYLRFSKEGYRYLTQEITSIVTSSKFLSPMIRQVVLLHTWVLGVWGLGVLGVRLRGFRGS